MEPYVVAPPRDDGDLGVRADAVVGVRTLGPDAPLTSDDIFLELSHQIEESHDRKSHDRKPRLPHKPPARRLTMQLRNGVQTLDAYRPTFDPGLDVATVVFSHIECVKTRASLAKVSKLWREASKPTAGLCALPVELKALILSKIEHIEAHHVLALSSTFQEAFSLLRVHSTASPSGVSPSMSAVFASAPAAISILTTASWSRNTASYSGVEL